jgi:hypothetical protein
MRGADNICGEELWQGTENVAEGHLAQIIWAKVKEEGLKVEVKWQDADASSATGFRYSFPNESDFKIMLCGGHVGRQDADSSCLHLASTTARTYMNGRGVHVLFILW